MGFQIKPFLRGAVHIQLGLNWKRAIGAKGPLKRLSDSVAKRMDLRDVTDSLIVVDGHFVAHIAWQPMMSQMHLVDRRNAYTYPLADAFVRRMNSLRDMGLRLFVIFDGAEKPAKEQTASARSFSREEVLCRRQASSSMRLMHKYSSRR